MQILKHSKTELEQQKKYKLFQCWTKMKNMRVAIGKSLWCNYNNYNLNPSYRSDFNLRQILSDEIIIEFDTDNKNKAWEGINFTAINLSNEGYGFEVWDHSGKSPHLHIRNLSISHLSKDELRAFKKFFIKKFVPEEYFCFVDLSLCGIHLIAIEWCEHWKGKYGVKRLLQKFEAMWTDKELKDFEEKTNNMSFEDCLNHNEWWKDGGRLNRIEIYSK